MDTKKLLPAYSHRTESRGEVWVKVKISEIIIFSQFYFAVSEINFAIPNKNKSQFRTRESFRRVVSCQYPSNPSFDEFFKGKGNMETFWLYEKDETNTASEEIGTTSSSNETHKDEEINTGKNSQSTSFGTILETPL